MNDTCHGQCLFGQCPFPHCMKGAGKRHKAQIIRESMEIETGFSLPNVQTGVSGYGIAVDIGTTTVAAALLHMETGRIISTESAVNPQVSFGPDVISRIQYCRQFGVSDLHEAIIHKLNEMIISLLEGKSLSRLCITANTTMLCLAAGLDPSSMGVYPFTPPSLFGRECNAQDIGLSINCPLFLAPCMGPFVGGDITTAILAASLTDGEPALLADIGTNGELALFANGELYSTSTAAGPAFEGASIRQGMAAIPGAICKVECSEKAWLVSTIGDTPAKGICGSGLISIINTLLKNGIVDETGLLEKESFIIAENVALYRQDVREIQMAKSAICAGILALCHRAGIALEEITQFSVAGGFGSHIDPKEAAGIGLFPSVLLPFTRAIGNAALGGCAMILCDPALQKKAKVLASSAHVVDLATDPVFMDEYIQQMYFE